MRFRAGAECPLALGKRAANLFSGSPAGVLPVAHFPELGAFLASARKSGHELRCYEDALAFIAQIRDAGEVRARDRGRAARMRISDDRCIRDPECPS